MNIITVIPLSKSKVAEELIYFSSIDLSIGSIVLVPLRRKNISAIVTKIEQVKDLKTNLKNAPFAIKKLNKIKSTAFFPESFIESCKELANYYATTIGAIIDTMVSNSILENTDKIVPPLPSQADLAFPEKKDSSQIFAIQSDDIDRISSWRSLIRQEFAMKKSVVIYLPTIEDCLQIYKALEKGIEGYIFMLNGDLTPKKIINSWKDIAEKDHPVVIISTGSFSVLPRNDIGTIIIEKENNRGWISRKTPYIDIRSALIKISQANHKTIYLADNLLRTETLYDLENKKIEEGSPFKWRSISTANDYLIDMRHKEPNNPDKEEDSEKTKNIKRKFETLSTKLKELIIRNREENTHLLIFVVRRGLSPITICGDCGNIVMCRQCKAAVTIHINNETGKNHFMCHVCGDRRSIEEDCKICGSWKLTPLGIGIDLVQEQLKSFISDIEIIKVDSDSINNEKSLNEAFEKFKTRPGSILLGTELAIQNFHEKIDHVAIISLDSLFSLPDFRIQERIMYIITKLRTQATRSILIQSRKTEQKIFEYGLKGNLDKFYKETIIERKQFNYPPFSVLIKITIEGKKDEIAKTMSEVTKFLEPYEIDIFPAFTSTIRGKSIIHGLIKIISHAWPDLDLIKKLKSLPPNVIIKINPESLL